MLNFFVFTDKLVSYEYFMDELKDYELDLLLEGHEIADKTSWDQTRMIMYSVLAPYQKKGRNLKPSDVMSFPWDDSYKPQEKVDREISDQQIDRMRNTVSRVRDIMINKQKVDGK